MITYEERAAAIEAAEVALMEVERSQAAIDRIGNLLPGKQGPPKLRKPLALPRERVVNLLVVLLHWCDSRELLLEECVDEAMLLYAEAE